MSSMNGKPRELVDPTEIRSVTDQAEAAARRFGEAQRELTGLLADLDRSQYWAFHGARAVEDWVEHRSGLDRREVRAMLRRSKLLARLPEVDKRASAGLVPVRILDQLAALADGVELDSADDAELAALLDEVAIGVLADRLADWFADSDEPAAESEEDRYRNRHVLVRRDLFGDLRADVYLPGDDGERFVSALDAVTAPPDPEHADEQRPLATRRADALVDLCVGETIAKPATTLVTAGRRRDHQSRSISRAATERLACDSAHVHVDLDLDRQGAPLDCGREHRTFNRHQRRALGLLYRRCGHPLCDVPFHRCEIHHATHWEDGGETNLANGVPFCRYHHHWLHERGWRLQGSHLTGWLLIPPDGSEPLACTHRVPLD